ncbi:hypothetical protein DOTSEDRAFT_29195 [Dothistroma septosporum NZE10]|uniref:Arb2 domain-containing protein n=1 Tax=Dothistroma septosporum (strain NZE10 / CBS 128990) TaxID=675120 RepID=M2Y132_DOTSN|nr:hypothetical protein DOTSEDRAFT_29195 [Dothistroma septosporum NZE10]
MFICRAPPQALAFPPELDKLGFELRNGTFVRKDESSPQYFDYFNSDDHDTNDRRKEAIHEAARTVVASELESEFDIKQIYIDSDGEINTTKPSEAHVTLLATEVSKLRAKRDVIIVIGEAAAGRQDAGIWAYRVLMNGGGIEQGSVVGLAKMVKDQAERKAVRQEVSKADYDEDLAASTAELGIDRCDGSTPGMIILNPGQLLYSSIENKSMSQVTWDCRPRATARSPVYDISDEYNKVPGHREPRDHIAAAFDDIIPRLVDPRSRLYIITIGDSAEHTISTLDSLWLDERRADMTDKINAVVMIDPQNIITGEVHSLFFQSFLSGSGITWKHSFHVPYGERIDLSLLGVGDINAKHTKLEEELKRFESSETSQTGADVDGPPQTSNTAVDGDDHSADDENQVEDPDDVLCPTYSAGDCGAITENVLPKVLPEVVRYLMGKMETARRYEMMNG